MFFFVSDLIQATKTSNLNSLIFNNNNKGVDSEDEAVDVQQLDETIVSSPTPLLQTYRYMAPRDSAEVLQAVITFLHFSNFKCFHKFTLKNT